MGELPFIWIFTRGSGPLWGQTMAATAGAGRRFRSPRGSCGAMDQSTLRVGAANQTPVSPGHLSLTRLEPCRRGHEVSASSSHAPRHRSVGGVAGRIRNPALPTKGVPGGVCMCRSAEPGGFVGYALCRFPEVRIPPAVLDGPLPTDRVPCRSGTVPGVRERGRCVGRFGRHRFDQDIRPPGARPTDTDRHAVGTGPQPPRTPAGSGAAHGRFPFL